MAKYTFIKGANETVVWDVKKDRTLAEFVDGIYETEKKVVADKLRELGYKEMKDYPGGPPKNGFVPKKTKLPPPKMELSPGGPTTPTQYPDIDGDPDEDVEEVKTVTNKKAPKKSVGKGSSSKKTLKRRKVNKK